MCSKAISLFISLALILGSFTAAIAEDYTKDISYDVLLNEDGSKYIFLRYSSYTMNPPAKVKFLSSDPIELIDWGAPCTVTEFGPVCTITKDPINGLSFAGVFIQMQNPIVGFCVRLMWDTSVLEQCSEVENSASESEDPTLEPTEEATSEPTEETTPTLEVTTEPTEEATPNSTEESTPQPTEEATLEPTEESTPEPTTEIPVEEPAVVTPQPPTPTTEVIVVVPPELTPVTPPATVEPPVTATPEVPTALDPAAQPTPIVGEGPVIPALFELRLPALAR